MAKQGAEMHVPEQGDQTPRTKDIGKHKAREPSGDTPQATRARTGNTDDAPMDQVPLLPTGSTSTNVDVSSMMEFLKLESEKRDKQHGEIVGSMNQFKNTVADLQKSIDLEKSTREKEIADIKKQLAEVEKRDQTLIDSMVKK